MSIIRFGHTWWGEKWLNALDKIDYSNRLPRGQRYARNGSVLSIEINSHKINARVQGRERQPYAVTMQLPVFLKKEQQQIWDLIKGNTYYLAKFESKILPTELYDELSALKIKLFPGSWKDMRMQCSCPDWAVPCKHIAAVIYLIANEIDKNPFIIFNLHNFDLLKHFQAAGKSAEEEITGIDSLLAVKPDKYSYYREKLEKIDFSLVPVLLDSTLKLLTAKPLFYLKGDFKEILYDQYKRMAKGLIAHINATEISEDVPEQLYSTAEIRIRKGKAGFKGFLKTKEQTLAFEDDSLQLLTGYLQVLTLGDLNTYPPVLAFLIMVHNFSLMLIQKSAYLPDILSLQKNTYIIRWIPALFSMEIKNIFETLEEALPAHIVKYGTAPLTKKEQVLFLISFFISYYLKLVSPVKDVLDDKMLALFFAARTFSPQSFEEQELARTIHLWLSRFFIRPKNCFPVIKIDEGTANRDFRFQILVKDRRISVMNALTLRAFLDTDNDEKFPLLKDLSLLSTYLSVVDNVLRTKAEVTVTSASFAAVWFDALPVLNTLGIETILPKTLREIFIPGLTLSLKKKKEANQGVISYLSLSELMDFNWCIAIGDQYLAPAEFLKLAAQYAGIVKFKDQYIYLDQKEIEKITKQLQKEPEFDALDLIRIHLTGRYKDVPIQTDKKLKELLTRFFKPDAVDLPAGLCATLRPYQLSGYRWLYHNSRIGLGSLIADDMGLGKTIQVITLLLKLKEEGLFNKKQVLIIVPATLLTNWQREFSRFSPDLKTSIYHGQERKLDTKADIILTTYSLMRGDAVFAGKRWLCVVVDEAQNIKNPGTGQTKTVKALKSEFKIAMTGTPVENRLMDYWSILDFIMKNLLGNQTTFKETFAIPVEKFRNQKQLQLFRSLTAPFILRRLKTDKTIIKDLPDKLTQNRYIELTKEQAALYQSLVNSIDTLLKHSEGIKRSGLIFKLITGLKQICNHPALYIKERSNKMEHSGKSLLLLDLVKKCLEQREKVIIFSQFREMGHLLEDIIGQVLGFNPLFLHGGLQRKKRDELVDSFQNDFTSRVMLLSLKAGGTGLNLTAANNVIHYDLWWNPAVENQATDRAFRIGQQKNVNVYRIITKNTFEEKINDMLEQKKELAGLTVNTGEKWITELSNKELKALLKLENNQ